MDAEFVPTVPDAQSAPNEGHISEAVGDDGIAVDGVLHLGSPPNILRRMIPIGCADQWENYVRSAMKSQLQWTWLCVGC